MRIFTVAAVVALLQSFPGPGASQVRPVPGYGIGGRPYDQGYGAQARVWVEDQRDFLRRGDRLRINFSTTADAYVAVLHIDPDGRTEFLFPSSPWDEQYVAAGRVYSLPYRNGGFDRGTLVRGGPGIGYLYIVASPTPLDYRYFQGRGGSGWDWSYAGQSVHGDPFWALEQMTRYLVPNWGYSPLAVDYYSYHVEGRHRYPAYACSSLQARNGWGWGWGGGYTPSYYGACNRLDYYLRDNPYYFDAGRYRGDRRSYFREYDSGGPTHRFKEDPDGRWSDSEDSRDDRSRTPARGRYLPSGTPARSGGSAAEAPAEPARRPAVASPAPERQPARGTTATPRAAPTVKRSPPPERAAGDGGSTEARRSRPE